jgi:hypothetical protein
VNDIFAHIMQIRPVKVTVAFRELAEGALWRCDGGEPAPAALLTCDFRRGRPPEQRARLAQALIDACVWVGRFPLAPRESGERKFARLDSYHRLIEEQSATTSLCITAKIAR